MPTNIYQRGLQLFTEADELAGADGSPVLSFTDLSGKNRHLTGVSVLPEIKADAVGGKKSVLFDGTRNPLVFNGAFKIQCGFLVMKTNGDFGDPFAGIGSSPSPSRSSVGRHRSIVTDGAAEVNVR